MGAGRLKRLFRYAHCMRRGRRRHRHKRSSALATRNSQVRDREYRLDPAPRSSLCSTATSHPRPPRAAAMHINVNASRLTPCRCSLQNSVTGSILTLHFVAPILQLYNLPDLTKSHYQACTVVMANVDDEQKQCIKNIMNNAFRKMSLNVTL